MYYYGSLSKVKSVSDAALVISQMCVYSSIMIFLFYLYGHHIWKPIDPSSLTRIEGLVIEKTVHEIRSERTYSFLIKTNDGLKRYNVRVAPGSACCNTNQVPIDQQVVALTDWSMHFSAKWVIR